jgi:hypothetical protein
MTREEYKEKVNPCYGCDCWDSDMGCTMLDTDRDYACVLEDGGENDGKGVFTTNTN